MLDCVSLNFRLGIGYCTRRLLEDVVRLLVLVVQDLLMCHSEGVGQLLALSSRTLRGRWFVSPRQESFRLAQEASARRLATTAESAFVGPIAVKSCPRFLASLQSSAKNFDALGQVARWRTRQRE